MIFGRVAIGTTPVAEAQLQQHASPPISMISPFDVYLSHDSIVSTFRDGVPLIVRLRYIFEDMLMHISLDTSSIPVLKVVWLSTPLGGRWFVVGGNRRLCVYRLVALAQICAGRCETPILVQPIPMERWLDAISNRWLIHKFTSRVFGDVIFLRDIGQQVGKTICQLQW